MLTHLTHLSTVYLIHWPVPLNPKGNHPLFPTLPGGKRDVDGEWDLKDTWKQMEALLKKGLFIIARNMSNLSLTRQCSGKVKSIGVSNFSEVKLEEILSTAEIIPAVNQVNILILPFITFLTRKALSVGTPCV